MRALKRSLVIVPLVALATILIGLPSVALGRDDARQFSTRLIGLNEVPSVLTDARGTFKLTINSPSDIRFLLTWQNLSATPTAAHIHFGQARTAGGVMIFLCGGGNQPACPSATSGTVEGTISAANVTGLAGQGVAAGDLAAALRAVRLASYANIHSTRFPGGEIRGQLQRGEPADNEDNSDNGNVDSNNG